MVSFITARIYETIPYMVRLFFQIPERPINVLGTEHPCSRIVGLRLARVGHPALLMRGRVGYGLY